MGPNFLECDRDHVLLLPPSLHEWLPLGHLAWFVIDAVERLDLTAFYRAYRGCRGCRSERGANAGLAGTGCSSGASMSGARAEMLALI